MPAKPSWFTRIPEIVTELRELDCPVVDRHVCEILFGVRRRRAIELMQRFGGYRTGNAIVLDRGELISSLERLLGSSAVVWERQRKQKVGERLSEMNRMQAARAIELPVKAATVRRGLSQLPNAVTIARGLLSVRFSTAEELFARLYEVAQLALDDFDAFRSRREAPAAQRSCERPISACFAETA